MYMRCIELESYTQTFPMTWHYWSFSIRTNVFETIPNSWKSERSHSTIFVYFENGTLDCQYKWTGFVSTINEIA